MMYYDMIKSMMLGTSIARYYSGTTYLRSIQEVTVSLEVKKSNTSFAHDWGSHNLHVRLLSYFPLVPIKVEIPPVGLLFCWPKNCREESMKLAS